MKSRFAYRVEMYSWETMEAEEILRALSEEIQKKMLSFNKSVHDHHLLIMPYEYWVKNFILIMLIAPQKEVRFT